MTHIHTYSTYKTAFVVYSLSCLPFGQHQRYVPIYSSRLPGLKYFPSHHYGQGESIAIAHLLWPFFNRNNSNKIEFWDCPSKARWHLHAIVDDDAKSTIMPSTPSQFTLLDALRDKSRKACTDWWVTTFNHGHDKGQQFLQLIINKKCHTLKEGDGSIILGSQYHSVLEPQELFWITLQSIQEEVLSSKQSCMLLWSQ